MTLRILAFETLASTNDEALARLKAGEAGGFVVTAARQTGGRGRHGRSWSSPAGNLYASIALRDPAEPAVAPQLGFVAGVALAQTLRARLGGDARLAIKWPNDMLFDGAKLAGMLLEATTLADGRLGCVIGIGVNCLSHPPDLPYPAIDLRAAGDTTAEPRAVLSDLLARFENELRDWRGGAGFAATRAAWLSLAAGLGRRMSVTTARGRVDGVFEDLDDQGRLRLATDAGVRTIEAGDVFLAPAAG